MSPTDRIHELLAHKGSELWSVTPHITVFEAIQLMSDREIGALPVIDGGQLAGMLSERDYARKIILQGRSSKDTLVGEIMTAPVVTVTPADLVQDGMRLMTEHRVRHLPVLENGRLIGIVSIGDLVNWIISAHEESIEQLRSYIAGVYPG
jgi:CBS domain-containing protein